MIKMILERIRRTRQEYPFQFWLLFVGMIISRTGASMIWPFMMVYISAQLDLPLASVATLFTINSLMGLVTSFVAGPVTDRAGRKGAMVVSLLGSGLSFVGMIWASSYGAFAVLMVLRGALAPLYQVGSNAMLADMLPPEKRDDGYATLRMGSNLGIALGPALGGVIVSQSYAITFSLAAAGMVIFGLLILFMARETMPAAEPKSEKRGEPWGGYPRVFRDGRFMAMVLSLTLGMIPVTIMWTLLAVHATQNYGLPESQFGLIPTTNAAMVVALQILVTRYTKRRPPFWMMALGALFYGLGVGSVALGRGFWGFWASMVIVTCGELILMPTAATYAANLAPVDMRGRYMSIYSLAWTAAFATGPVVGGFLNDNFGPLAIWYGAAAFGLLSALSFARLAATRGQG
jgi:predicted MFS family arabinose efflux permease